MANYWMHNGFLQVEGEKMAKSEGNFVTLRQLLADGWNGRKWQRGELRLLMLSTHYRQPIDWTFDALVDAQRTIEVWQRLTASVRYERRKIAPSAELLAALLDDLNVPQAITHLHSIASKAVDRATMAFQLYSDLVTLGIFADRKEQVLRLMDDKLVKALEAARGDNTNGHKAKESKDATKKRRRNVSRSSSRARNRTRGQSKGSG
jgi:cysteinyl-tRNA synthetase